MPCNIRSSKCAAVRPISCAPWITDVIGMRVSPRAKRFYASRFASARGTHWGVNAGRIDLAQLNVISLEARCWDQDAIEIAIRRVSQGNGWLILYTHDVSETPSCYGSTPKMLDWALERVTAARIDILPMREALPVALGL